MLLALFLNWQCIIFSLLGPWSKTLFSLEDLRELCIFSAMSQPYFFCYVTIPHELPKIKCLSIYMCVCVSVCVCVNFGGGISTGLMSCFTNSRKESCSWIAIHFAATLQYRQTKNAILSCRQIDKSFIFTNIVYKQLFLTTRDVLKADMVWHGLKIDLFWCFGPFSYWFGISQTKELVRVSISESN